MISGQEGLDTFLAKLEKNPELDFLHAQASQKTDKNEYTANTMLSSRFEALMKSQNEQSTEPVKKKEPVKKITEMTPEEQLNEFKPKTDEDFQIILYKWLRRFHRRHLAGLEEKLNQV